MIPLLLWTRRLWPYAALAALVAGAFALEQSCHAGGEQEAFAAAHRTTAAAEVVVRSTDTVFRRDTVVARSAVTVYRTARDTVLQHLTDTVRVKAAFTKADNALALDSTAVASAARSIAAHVVLESGLRTELALANRLRAPRYQVSSLAGVDVGSGVPITGLETSVRLAEHWAVVGRLERRWEPGSATRRAVLARYTF